MLVPYFYNEITRKYISIFGTLFNNIDIVRKDESDIKIQKMKVPINHGPVQKYLSRISQDPNLEAPAIILPRMSYEIVNIAYDSERVLTKAVQNSVPVSGGLSVLYVGAPYNIEFQLSIIAKNYEDGVQILEQIIPFFKPDFTISAKMLSQFTDTFDIPIILNSITKDDSYEASYEERRTIIWTLSFTMKAIFFGPTYNKKQIKHINVNFYDDIAAILPSETVEIFPAPANTINFSNVNWANVNQNDNYTIVVNQKHTML